jgi:ubiquinone/menaquinone biosynthesis C-methylase UbiE
MNETHLQFLASPQWAEQLAQEMLPWVAVAGDLGKELLEIGPGPGVSTDLLRKRVFRLTAGEADPSLPEALQRRLANTNVEVLCGDGANTGLSDDRFSAATAFSVLHHVPTAEHQDRILAEICRVLRPGGIPVGIDSRDLDMIREGHDHDIFVPIDPETFPERLRRVGFGETTIDMTDWHSGSSPARCLPPDRRPSPRDTGSRQSEAN